MQWKLLSWVDGRYEVSDTGTIRSWTRARNAKALPRLLRARNTPTGYAQVRLPVMGVYRSLYVHRLVLQAFTETVGEQVNHKNGVRNDNRLNNLEWCTAGENQKHAYRVLGKQHPRPHKGKTGALCKLSRPVAQMTLDGRVVRQWDAIADTAEEGFSKSCVGAVCRGERRTHAGFMWSFV